MQCASATHILVYSKADISIIVQALIYSSHAEVIFKLVFEEKIFRWREIRTRHGLSFFPGASFPLVGMTQSQSPVFFLRKTKSPENVFPRHS